MTSVKTIKSDTQKQVKDEIAVIRGSAKKVTASRESARAFLYRAGILTKKGNLKKVYR